MKASPKKYNYIFLGILATGIGILLLGAISEGIILVETGLLIAFGSFLFRIIFSVALIVVTILVEEADHIAHIVIRISNKKHRKKRPYQHCG